MKLASLLLCLLLSTSITFAKTKNTTYSGTLKGYTTAWGFNTGKIIVEDAVTGKADMYLIHINPDGKFTTDFPLTINKECWISFPFFNSTVYFLAGKKLIQNFDLSVAPKVSSVFEGDGSKVNNDMNKVRLIISVYNWDGIYSDIYQYTPEQYKAYFSKIQAQKLAAIDSVAQTAGFNKTAYHLAINDIKYMVAGLLTSYNYYTESAYRIRNKLSFENRAPASKAVTLDPAYYDFLQKIRYNNPAAMTSYNYNIFLKRLKFLDLIYDKAGRIDYTEEIKKLKQLDTTAKEIELTLKYYRESMLRNATLPGTLGKARPEVLKSLINKDITLELELMSLQDTCQNINDNKVPLTDAALARLKSKLKRDDLFESVLQLNNNVKKEIESSKIQTGYVINETPKVAVDNVFDNIINNYKGKVIFIDFWATWCGPCLQGMQDMKPLKTELQNEDVIFLYITNHTSPESTYKFMIADIKGEHYRVSADEYNFISERFKINGIPHYTIIDKKGKVINNGSHVVDIGKLKTQLMQMIKE